MASRQSENRTHALPRLPALRTPLAAEALGCDALPALQVPIVGRSEAGVARLRTQTPLPHMNFSDPAVLLFASGVLTGIGLSLLAVTIHDSIAILRFLRHPSRR